MFSNYKFPIVYFFSNWLAASNIKKQRVWLFTACSFLIVLYTSTATYWILTVQTVHRTTMLEVIGYLIIIFKFICLSLQIAVELYEAMCSHHYNGDDHTKQCVAIIYNGDDHTKQCAWPSFITEIWMRARVTWWSSVAWSLSVDRHSIWRCASVTARRL